MAQPYIGEIRMFAGNFAPAGWLFCDGSLLQIADNDTLFNLIGTTYGGDGETTFALPDLRSRVPVHQGAGFPVAQTGGVEQVTLTTMQIPAHTHALTATTVAGSATIPAGNVLAQVTGGIQLYYEGQSTDRMSNAAITPLGSSQPHTNIQPYLAMNFIISQYGIYPSPD